MVDRRLVEWRWEPRAGALPGAPPALVRLHPRHTAGLRAYEASAARCCLRKSLGAPPPRLKLE